MLKLSIKLHKKKTTKTRTGKSYATNHMIIHELDFQLSVTNLGEMSGTFDSDILAPKCELKAFIHS